MGNWGPFLGDILPCGAGLCRWTSSLLVTPAPFPGNALLFGLCLGRSLGSSALATPPSEMLELLSTCQTPNCTSKPMGTRGTVCSVLPF